MVIKHSKWIAVGAVALLVAVLLVAFLTGPRQSPGASVDEEQETQLTPQQQDRVDDMLKHCFDTGDC